LNLNLKEPPPPPWQHYQPVFGKRWFSEFKDMKAAAPLKYENGKKVPAPDSLAWWANQNGVNVMAAESLHSKLGRLFHAGYITAKPAGNGLQSVGRLLKNGSMSFSPSAVMTMIWIICSFQNLITRKIPRRMGTAHQRLSQWQERCQ
jgi:hypothetical protein